MVACDDYDADEEGIRGAYSGEVVSDRLLRFVFETSVRRFLVGSFAGLLRNRDVGPANLFRIDQTGGNGWCHRWELAIIEVEFLNPIPESKELWGFDELGER